MSTLWTPSGEHRVPRAGETEQAKAAPSSPARPGGLGQGPAAERGSPTDPTAGEDWEPTPDEVAQAQEELDVMRAQLLEAPVEVVIANHAMGIWELAALHLSNKPPQFAQAQLAIDALAALVDGLHGRIGEAEKTLADGLSQIRMAYVQLHRAEQARLAGHVSSSESAAGTETPGQ